MEPFDELAKTLLWAEYMVQVADMLANDPEWAELYPQVIAFEGIQRMTFDIGTDCFGNGVLHKYAVEEIKDFCKRLLQAKEKAMHQLLEQHLMSIPTDQLPHC